MKALDNLVKIGQLKIEPADAKEFAGMLQAGDRKLKDAQIVGLSEDSQFSLAYGAAHALSLAALRWHGYRSDKRYLVFQCLQHTLDLDKTKWRVLATGPRHAGVTAKTSERHKLERLCRHITRPAVG